MEFVKYAALSNDFVLLDWWAVPDGEVDTRLNAAAWPHTVQKWCHRKLGIGADGVLIVYQQQGKACARIFNQDGSDGQFCGNGARAVAHYLKQTKHFPNAFTLAMGGKVINCEVGTEVSTAIELGQYGGASEIQVEKIWYAHRVDVGNPHLIIFNQVTADWLKAHGKRLETYFGETRKTNVEFVWETSPGAYQMEVFERGVGYSEACGSGAMAVTQALHELGRLPENQMISIHMPGGSVKTGIKHGKIYLTADVRQVFTGSLPS